MVQFPQSFIVASKSIFVFVFLKLLSEGDALSLRIEVVFLVKVSTGQVYYIISRYIKFDAVPMIFPAHVIADCKFEDNLCGWKSFSPEGEGGWKLSSRNLNLKGKSTLGWHRLKPAPDYPRQDFAVQLTLLLKLLTNNHPLADTSVGRLANLFRPQFQSCHCTEIYF